MTSYPPTGQQPFEFPRYYDFPPMYTLQPNANTRAAQLDKWSSLLQSYCAHHKLYRLSIPTAASSAISSSGDSTSVFTNSKLSYTLKPDAAKAVVEHMRAEGRAEWISPTAQDGAYIYWRTPNEWASLIEAWLEDTGQRAGVLTLFELREGDVTRGSDIHGMDEGVLRAALDVLVKKGKAKIFGDQDSPGVKFF